MDLIELDRLKELLLYDPASGQFMWTHAAHPRVRGQQAGKVDKSGYVLIQVEKRVYLGHRLAWFFVHGGWPTEQLDHVNRDRADNRIGNLRSVTRSQNMQNTGLSPKNKSGFKGVHYDRRWNGRWCAKIKINGRGKHLGCFQTPEAAAEAYRAAAAKLHTHNPVVDAQQHEALHLPSPSRGC